MNRWIISIGLVLTAGFATGQTIGGYTETRTYTIWAANSSNNPHGDRGNVDEAGPFSFHFMPGPFHDEGTGQGLDAVGPIGTFSTGKIRWTQDSVATGSLVNSDMSSGVQFSNFSFNPVPGLSISAHMLTTSSTASYISGAFSASEATYVRDLTISAFGQVLHFDGNIAPDAVLWSGKGITIYGNFIEGISVWSDGADVSIYGLYVSYSGVDLGGGNDVGYSYFGGVRSILDDFGSPFAHPSSGIKRPKMVSR